MHALVTGGGGFLGRYICEQLIARGDRVRSFGRGVYPELESMGVEVVRGDITDADAISGACEGIECVFHVAARPGVSVQPKPYYQINTQGTQHVIDACQAKRVPRLVYTSSPSVTFMFEDQCGVDELDPRHLHREPHNMDVLGDHRAHYSRSKLHAEEKVLDANGRDGLATCALRPHLIWGPRDQHLIPRLLERAKSGRLRRVGDGSNLVDIIYVENAATAHLQVADALSGENSRVAGNAYFLSQGEPVNCWQWIDEILALADLPPVEKSISYMGAFGIGSVLELVYRLLLRQDEPPMTRFVAAQLAMSHWFDISAARRDFGYEPQVSTAEGMRRLGEWLRSDHAG